MLTREIADAIRVTLTPQEEHRFCEGPLRGRGSTRHCSKVATTGAGEQRRAAAKQSGFSNKRSRETANEAMAFPVGLADSYLSLAPDRGAPGGRAAERSLPEGQSCRNQRALDIDDTLGEAHASLGHIKFQYDRDWPWRRARVQTCD